MTRRLVPGSQEYREIFDSFAHSAFRLETLQRYQVDYEREPLRRFLAGESRPHDPHKEGWITRVRSSIAVGKTMRRVHVVIEPLSDYLRYELTWGYQDNVAAGEEIGIIAVSADQWPAELPRHDFWLFDGHVVLRMIYDHEARLIGADLVDDPAEIVNANHWCDAAMHAATPYRDYVSSHPDLLPRAS